MQAPWLTVFRGRVTVESFRVDHWGTRMYHTARFFSRTWWALAIVAAMIVSMAIAFPAVASAGAAGSGLPTKAVGSGAAAAEYRTAATTHRGWVYLNLNYCAPGRACAAIHAVSTTAYRWTGRSWSTVALPGGWVYVSPYTGQWRWAWTKQTGWLVVGTGRFELR